MNLIFLKQLNFTVQFSKNIFRKNFLIANSKELAKISLSKLNRE